MTPVSLNPSGDDALQGQNQFFISPISQDSPTFFNIFDPTQTIEFGELRHGNYHHDHKLVLQDGSSSNFQQFSFNSSSTRDPTYKMEEEEIKNGHGSAKWMSSKMRLMKKMMRPGSSSSTDKAINTTTNTAAAAATPRPRFQYQRHENRYSQRSPRNNNNNSSNATRVCSDCNTSTTPLWRSGPMGPKSLCNACGIRQRKARRAMMESENGLTTPKNIAASTKTRVYNKEKKPRTNNFVQSKNTKYKPTETTTASSSSSQSVDKLETSDMSLKNNSDSEQVCPWDEAAQAAVLLMSLSYGFIPIINYNYI